MMKRRRLILVGMFALAGWFFAGCVVMRMQEAPPEVQSELIFSHARHAKMDIACATCHDASKSVLATDNLLPNEASCMTCHSRAQGCELCHRNASAVAPIFRKDTRFRFPHATHLKPEVNPDGCPTCHSAVAKSTRVSETHPITLKDCQKCHAPEMSEGPKCGMCHQSLTPGSFLPVSHSSTWAESHGEAATKADGLCDVCHRGTVRADFVNGPSLPKTPVLKNHAQNGDVRDCADCHRADIWPQTTHENNYLQSHPLDALRSETTCETCHQRNECLSCHVESNLTFEEIHPPDFVLSHAPQARRELGACATCHTEDTCISCHQRVSPHPAGWDVEITSQNQALCRKCHPGGGVE